jgi:hypothetical protein
MSTNGAYSDEMNDVALFTDALRAAVPAQPRRDLTATLVPRLAATARTSTIEAEAGTSRRSQGLPPGRPRSRRGLVARVAIAVALIPLLLAGLAVAGVTVPSPARSAFDRIGIHLPNQPKDKAEDDASGPGSQPPADESEAGGGQGGGGGASEAQPGTRQGKSKGRGKANVNGDSGNQGRGKAIGRNDAVPPGHSGQTGPPAHSNAGGNAGGSSGGGSSSKPPKTKQTPQGVAKGHAESPPGQSK